MELEEGILSQLPDDELYHLLTLCDMKEVLHLRQVIGAKREEVFALAEKYFQRKYFLWDLPLLTINHIVNLEDGNESVAKAIAYGDYPEYVTSIHEKIKILWNAVEVAIMNKREESAIALMQFAINEELWYGIILAMNHRCEKCLLYVAGRYDFEQAINNFFEEWHWHGDPDFNHLSLLWAIKTLNPQMTNKLAFKILTKIKDINLILVDDLVQRLSDKDLVLLLGDYRRYVADIGGRLAHCFEVIDHIQGELKQRGLE